MIDLAAVGVQYADGTVAVDGVSLHVPTGQFCILLGPSGAGKSTLLRLLNGMQHPTSGSVIVHGERFTKRNARRIQSRIAMIHQHICLVLRLPVLTNVLSGALPRVSLWRSMTGLFPQTLRRKACQLLEQVGLQEKHLYRRALQLSGGQQQRAAIARAFMLDPSIVLADEPVASLDVETGRAILALLKRASTERQATVLCSLHQVQLAREFADRIIGIESGKIVFDGAPEQFDRAVEERLYERTPAPSRIPTESDGAAAAGEDASATPLSASKVEPPAGVSTAESPWRLRPVYSAKMLVVTLVACVLLAFSARQSEVDRGVVLTVHAAAHAMGLSEQSEVADGWNRFIQRAFPFVLADKTAVGRIPGFDPQDLPPWSYLTQQEVQSFDVATGTMATHREVYLVQRYGYVLRVLRMIVSTLEIALWGTILALVLAAPLACLAARNITPHRLTYGVSRLACSFNRAIPELISAMFFVLMVGFGPLAGILALGLHSAGFLGKFFADDIENTDPGAWQALLGTGAGKLKAFRYAVFPQVMPQMLAYSQYILERNFRAATVLGVVGAGGIGMELKGRWDEADFGHVSTILLGVLVTVLIMEQLTQFLRTRMIHGKSETK